MPTLDPAAATVLVAAVDESLVLQVIRALGLAGAKVVLAGTPPCRLAARSRFVKAWLPLTREEFDSPGDASIAKVSKACADHRVDIVVGVDETALVAICRWKARLPELKCSPMAEEPLIRLLDDKWTFYELLGRLGIRTPKTRLASTAAELAASASEFPLLLKPPHGRGGFGIVRCESRADLERAKGQVRFPILIQEFVPGTDVDSSVLATQGRVLVETVQTREPEAFVFFSDPSIGASARRVVESTGYTGVAHFDMRRHERSRDIYMIECNPRYWRSLQYSVFAGVNFPALGIELGLRGRLASPPRGLPASRVLRGGTALKKLLTGSWADINPETWAKIREHARDPVPDLSRMLGRFL
ncbi:MAG: ATP-grasp domain-containing protein [Proteobacteria bacterium]|nr:ATP-grasp domain-containing protein [Pseudomonadota bacterium]